MSPGDVEKLRAAGLSDREILDLAHVIGFFAYANRLVDGLGCELEREMDGRKLAEENT
jgi:alkylhydroperoxidase family enzyme